MANQFAAWMSAGVSAAAVAGAGAAIADDGSTDGGGATTSDSSKSSDDQYRPSTKPPDDPKKADEDEKPAPAHQWTVIDLFVDALLRQVPSFDACAEDPSAAVAALTSQCSASPQTPI
jgi:hypothetical protein